MNATTTARERGDGDSAADVPAVEVQVVDRQADLPSWADVDHIARFLHQKMRPYEDRLEDVRRGIDHALGDDPAGGFVVVASAGGALAGAVVFLETAMSGFVPEALLLFACVDPALRGRGIGRRLIETGLERCTGGATLHVEPDNPARRLYERIGFSSKYVDMRWSAS